MTVTGNATRSSVLRIAGVPHAKAIVVATNRDDTEVLVTLTAREPAPKITIVAAVREAENVHLLRQSGATSVVVSAETAGRLLGVVRDDELHRVDTSAVDSLERGDRLLYVRKATHPTRTRVSCDSLGRIVRTVRRG